MRLFKNILLYFNDEFEGIKPLVINFVRQYQAKISIIDVFEDFDQFFELLPPDSSIEELKQIVIDERRQHILSFFNNEGLKDHIEIVFKFGNPAVEIIRQVIREKHDLVIKAATGEKSFKDRLFGNIAVKLLRKCPCPVLILKPSNATTFNKILAPVDPEIIQGEAAEGEKRLPSLSKNIMETSISASKMANSHLDILHCWFLPGEALLSSGRTKIDPGKMSQMKSLAEKIHTQRAMKLLDEYDFSDIDYSMNILKGDPRDLIPDFAEKNGSDLIVMGTVSRSGLAGMLIGSTAENVIDNINCSILVLKPENYKSPIHL